MRILFNETVLLHLVSNLRVKTPQSTFGVPSYRVVLYAYQDLQTYLGVKWNMTDSSDISMTLESYVKQRKEEVDGFLDFWVGQWIKKWKDRVRVVKRIPLSVACEVGTTKKGKMQNQLQPKCVTELEKIATRKLVNQGEICLTKCIARHLVKEEVERALSRSKADVNSFEVFNELASRIAGLRERNGPLIYLSFA